MDVIDILCNDSEIRKLSNQLLKAVELNLKDEAIEIRSLITHRSTKLLQNNYPSLKMKQINGLCVDYDWKTLMRADPNLFIWFGLIIFLFSFMLGFVISKFLKTNHSLNSLDTFNKT